MRVLHLTHNYPRFRGDASGAFIEELLEALVDNGVEPYVLCPHAKGLNEMEHRDGIRIRRFRYAQERLETLAYEGKMLDTLKQGAKGLGLFVGFLQHFADRTRRLITRERIDVVHAHWLLPGGVAARAALSGSSLPLVVSSHGTDVRLLEKLPVGGLLARWVLSRSRLALPVSGYLEKKLLALTGGACRTSVLPMPASASFLASSAKKLKRRVIGVGNLIPQKRFDILIGALGTLNRTGLELELTLVGAADSRPWPQTRGLETGYPSWADVRTTHYPRSSSRPV